MRLKPLMERVANPLRGTGYRDMAHSFAQRFALELEFTNAEFDEWAFDAGYLERPHASTKTNSLKWLGHRTARGRLRRRLNQAGCHPQMGSLAFRIVQIRKGHDRWEAISPLKVVQDPEAFDGVARAIDVERKWFRYAVESIEWSSTQPHDRMQVEFACRMLDHLAKELEFKTTSYKELCEEYRGIVSKAIDRGGDPSGAALKRLLYNKGLPFGED